MYYNCLVQQGNKNKRAKGNLPNGGQRNHHSAQSIHKFKKNDNNFNIAILNKNARFAVENLGSILGRAIIAAVDFHAKFSAHAALGWENGDSKLMTHDIA